MLELFSNWITQTTPETPAAVYWAIISALAAAVAGLFWQLVKAQTEHTKTLYQTINNVTAALLATKDSVISLEKTLKIDEKLSDLEIVRRKR